VRLKSGKKYQKGRTIKLASTPNQTVLIKGDLSKLKQLLVKFFTSAVQQLQIDGENVQVDIVVDSIGRLKVSAKLGGRQINPNEFESLCSTLESFKGGNERVGLDMAIAKIWQYCTAVTLPFLSRRLQAQYWH